MSVFLILILGNCLALAAAFAIPLSPFFVWRLEGKALHDPQIVSSIVLVATAWS